MIANAVAQSDRPVIITGDFNDYNGDLPDASNSRPISKTIQILKSSPNGASLKSTAEFAAQEDRFSYCSGCSRPRCNQIDHMLVAPELIGMVFFLFFL